VNNNLESVSKILHKHGQDAEVPFKLRKNQIVEAKVVQSSSSGRAVLLIKGKKVAARASAHLIKGSVVSLKVEKSMPVPTFQLLEMKLPELKPINISMVLSALKENLWAVIDKNIHSQGISKTEAALFRKLMNDLSIELFAKSDSKPNPDMLRMLIDKLGLNWEAKFRKALKNKLITRDKASWSHLNKLLKGDLKGLVSRFLNLKDGQGFVFKRFVSTIENIQLINHQGLDRERKIFLPVPMQFSDGLFTIGELLIQLPPKVTDENQQGKQKTGKEPFSITFLLELSNLGPVRVELTSKGDKIEGRFLLATRETKAFIENNLQPFISGLENRGFTILRMDCQVKKPEMIKKSLVNEIIQGQDSSISLVA